MTAAGLVGHVGGLAVALGAGVVIGLAVSAPASADAPRGGAESAATERATSTPRRASGPGARVAHTPTAHSTRPAATVSTRSVGTPRIAPAAAARQSRSETRPAQSVPVAPTVIPAVSTVPSTVAPPAASAPAPKSVRSLFGWGDPRGRLITIYKGTHFAIPNSFGFFIRQVSGTGTFTANTVYDLKDSDQYDWNKFTGIAFTPLEPDRNSVMVGWRYNLNTKEFEIAPFYNVEKKRILPNELTEVISVPADQTFDYFVDYSGVTISYGGRTVYKPYPEGLTPNVWKAARVSGWFGGNEVAPRTVSYYLKLG